jgi:hypothetical protein
VYDDVVKDQIKKTVAKDSEPNGKQIGIKGNNGEIVEKSDGRNTKNDGEKIVPFQGMVMNRMVGFVPGP